MSILTTPQRLAEMLIDCDESIIAGYPYTQNSIDQLERPCWLVFVEDAQYPKTTPDEELVEQAYSLAYVGQVFSSDTYNDSNSEYELIARRVAVNAIRYLFERPTGIMSNIRGMFDSELGSLDELQLIRVEGRSSVALYSRDGVEGESFWGFTIDITCIEQMIYETQG